MSKINRHPVRRTAAGVLASALVLSGAVAAAVPAQAAVGFDLVRVQGDDRYETSAAVATAFGPATSVILASGEQGRTPDALAANFLAGVRNAPVLLTRRDTTPASILAAIRASGATRITVVGGTVAVSNAQIESLRAAGFTVDRVAGDDRYQTAAAVAAAGEGATASNVGLVASGVSTIDALAGGPLAYKGRHPLFLVTRDGIPGATLAAMRANGVTSVFILGGEAVVGPRVVAQLRDAGITVNDRLFGADRSATSVAIANALVANFGFSAATFNLASGLNEGIDALGGAALSGKENRVLLITNNATSAAPVTAFATTNAPRLTAPGRIFGGSTVVAATLETGVETAAGAGQGFQTLSVTPTDAATLQLAADEAADAAEATTDNRTYTVTGLDDALTYRITLVNAASIQGTGTSRTFLSSAIDGSTTAFAVNPGADIADIVSVGGTTPEIGSTDGEATANTATVRPVNGSITFVVDGEATGTVVPAVYVNGGQGGTATTGGASNRLETSATEAGAFAAATEVFGLGGPTTFINPAAESQVFGDAVTVQAVSKATNQFDAGDATFTYDANDTFRIAGGVALTLEEFEARLSSEDTIDGSYSANPALASVFELDDANPAEPAAPAAVVGEDAADSNDITVTATVTGDVDQVRFERAPVTGEADDQVVGTFAAVATEAATDDVEGTEGTQVVYVDNNLAAGRYAYRVVFINDGDTGPESAPSTIVEATTPPAPDTTAPTVLDARVGTNGGSAFLIDEGDSFVLYLSEAVEAAEAGDTIRVRDGDGTTVDFVANTAGAEGASTDFTTNADPVTVGTTTFAAGRVLTVAADENDVVVALGTEGGLDIPATITRISGVSDAADNTVALAGSADLVIDNE